uniref:PPM-type phosphatase domain-containing protein n=1 Tax=Chromera velia CCMP2878 TaxID=1169474 RepID=A0A0G4IBV6_9ALVE|mmetsp:Transcript_12693/g.24725  ORF Transcript_12693/g.24725 Transcript_12693/m.24725 type:complete len:358 (-) Transcript_12693:2148-3221(-)|eukprot:Cvel_2219.t1-p1 / transcript=Cvel_2219.t1 / gene=Cvel_2219 / organism=Chromera_velia_CCMP2878 / gene_product=Probable protein phosphatase 2C 65, putative / transcript_product=Probable protein phosphatase 2C 65, putative / location=Cvel_scaffold85:131432-133491(-) / protein_length=357 / sequence_SO=supercontig / SO=protein_coding / is_pseudo=false
MADSSPARRRLSVVNRTDAKIGSGFAADGTVDPQQAGKVDSSEARRGSVSSKQCGVVQTYASLSQVGQVPHNPLKQNQDSKFSLLRFANIENCNYFSVCDGHGYYGGEVSGFVKKTLPACLAAEKNLATDPQTCIRKAFMKTEKELESCGVDVAFSGTTCVSVMIKNRALICANIGDSRAVMARCRAGKWYAIPLSDDHKPDRADEMKRIVASGGKVESFKGDQGEAIGPARVWLRHTEAPGLAMSRSFGDGIAKTVGVTCEPEFKSAEMTSDDKFIVLASDGVWEFLSNEDVVKIVRRHWQKNNAESACDELVQQAVLRWKQEEEVVDDTTVIVVFLDVPPAEGGDAKKKEESRSN